MAVEIVEALEPKKYNPPALQPLVLKWRHGCIDWERCHYFPEENEALLDAARRLAREESAIGYHVRIVTVDEKP